IELFLVAQMHYWFEYRCHLCLHVLRRLTQFTRSVRQRSSESFPKRDIALAARFFEGSAHFFVPPELFSRFRLADGVRGAEQIAEDANAVGIGEIGGEFDLRGKPLFPKLASTHNDIIASAGVISKEWKLKKRL